MWKRRAWEQWILIRKYRHQLHRIEQRIIQQHHLVIIKMAIRIWKASYHRELKLKRLRLQISCRRFYIWWKLQSSLSRHYKHVHRRSVALQLLNGDRTKNVYHSLDQKSRNVFAYWYTKRLHHSFTVWKTKQIYNSSMRRKSVECKRMHRVRQRKRHFSYWREQYLHKTRHRRVIDKTAKMIKTLVIIRTLSHWNDFRNRENKKRCNMLHAELFESNNRVTRCYRLWKRETEIRVDRRLKEEKADGFYESRIRCNEIQCVFGQWLLVTIQSKDIKRRIEQNQQRYLMRKYWRIMVMEMEYNRTVREFQQKWKQSKDLDVSMRIFMVWKRSCKYPISLLPKKNQIEALRRCRIFRIWYNTVYQRQKLRRCQLIAKQCSVQSAFIRWKVTMKHHLLRKRNEVYLRNKHQRLVVLETVTFWKDFVDHQHRIKCHSVSLAKVCDEYIYRKHFDVWFSSYRLSMRFKAAQRYHSGSTRLRTIRYWLRYCRRRQKYEYMLQLASQKHNSTLLINTVTFWSEYKKHRVVIKANRKLADKFMARKHLKLWSLETIRNLSLKSRINLFTVNLNAKRKYSAMEWWKTVFSKNRNLMQIRDKICHDREYKSLSSVFNRWYDQSHELQTMRILHEEAIGLHSEKVLTQIFSTWKQMLPLLKREKYQMKRPQLVLNFYRWRNVSAVNNDLRDKLYFIELKRLKTHFMEFRAIAMRNQERRERGYAIIDVIQNEHRKRIGIDHWMAITAKSKMNLAKARTIENKRNMEQKQSIWDEWKLLFEVTSVAKHKQLSNHFEIWRKEFRYKQIESIIIENVVYRRIKKYAFNQWRALFLLLLHRQKCLGLMMQRTEQRRLSHMFAIWKIEFAAARLRVRCTRTAISIRISFWRQYTNNRITTGRNLQDLKASMRTKWSYYPSAIYQSDYSDDSGAEDEYESAWNADIDENGKTALFSPLHSVSMIVASNSLAPKAQYHRPTTPTLIGLSSRSAMRTKYDPISKDDMFISGISKKIEIVSCHNLEADDFGYFESHHSTKTVLKQVIFKWRNIGSFIAFKRWKDIVHTRKREEQLLAFAQHEFREKALEKVICVWKHSVNIKKSAQILTDTLHRKRMVYSFAIWKGVYQHLILSRMYEQTAVLHHKAQCKRKGINFWRLITLQKKICVAASEVICENRPKTAKKVAFTKWHRLFLFVQQTRNENDCADLYYVRCLIRKSFLRWNRSYATKSIIDALLSNTIIQHECNVKREILTIWSDSIKRQKALEQKMYDLTIYHQFKCIKESFSKWQNWHRQLLHLQTVASEVYIQNTFKCCFTKWRCALFERHRDRKLNEMVDFYSSMRMENTIHETLLFWKYLTDSRTVLNRKEMVFYRQRLVPNVFVSWKLYTQNKRISANFYYLKTLQKTMRNWKIWCRKRKRIYHHIDSNFANQKMQRIQYQLNEWRVFTAKRVEINRIAEQLIEHRGGIAFGTSSNGFPSVSVQKTIRFQIVHSEPSLLQSEAFSCWKAQYERRQKIKYVLRLIRLERFVAEWNEFTKLQNRKKYLMSKVPIIARNTAMKKHFNLWLKYFREHRELQRVHDIISNRRCFHLMKNTFIAFRDYIDSEKQKAFLVRRLLLCHYVDFWRIHSQKVRSMNKKLNDVNTRRNSKLQSKALVKWKEAQRDQMVRYHVNEFKMSYGRCFHLQIWRDITMQSKVEKYRHQQMRQQMRDYIAEWREYTATKISIETMNESAVRYHTENTYRHVLNLWQQQLCDRYTLQDARATLVWMQLTFGFNKWRTITDSKRICVAAREIILDAQRKQSMFQWLNEWRNSTVAHRHYQQTLVFSAFDRWLSIHEEIKMKKLEHNTMHQIVLVWHNNTQQSLRENQRKSNIIAKKRLAMSFKIWINEMESQQYLRQIYLNAAKYHISLSLHFVVILPLDFQNMINVVQKSAIQSSDGVQREPNYQYQAKRTIGFC